jgi:gas vesicle protein
MNGNYLNWDGEAIDRLSYSIMVLANELSKSRDQITKQDLRNLEERINMKLSEIKAQAKVNAAKSAEALQEVVDKIDQLIVDATDPDVTDQDFLADLTTTRDNLQKLADIVPNESTETTV